MKALLITSFLAISLNILSESVIDSITLALRAGRTTEINQYFANSVDVTILDYQDFLDKEATIRTVNAFFEGKTISGYKVIHEGKSKGKDSVYTIGTLTTDQGEYKIFMFVTSQNGQLYIEEIKIEG